MFSDMCSLCVYTNVIKERDSLNSKYTRGSTHINQLHVFVCLPNHKKEEQTLDLNRLTSSAAVLFQRGPAAKSLSEHNNSVTAVQNTHPHHSFEAGAF